MYHELLPSNLKQKKILHSAEVVYYHSNNFLSKQVFYIYSEHYVTLLW